MSSGGRLDSWKAIAEYLGRDRTTVMRWKRTAGLPVRRVAGAKRGSVFAYKEEVDTWLEGRAAEPDEPVAPRLQRFTPRGARIALAAGIVLLTLSGLAIARIWAVSPNLASASLAGEDLVALDARGREAWRYRLPHVDGGIVLTRSIVTDVTGDGHFDVVAAVHFMGRGGHAYGRVMLFDHHGRLRWERSLEDRYRFGEVDYGPSWFPEDVVVYRAGEAIRIAVANHHHTWWPSVIATYDADGTVLHRFVHQGWLRSVNVTKDGRYLLAAGISNAFDGAALAILDTARPEGTAPADGGTLPSCGNCPAGAPLAYFMMPWADVARRSDTPPAVAHVMDSGGIEWRAAQHAVVDGKVPEVIVTLSRDLQVLQRSVNDYLVEARAALRTGGSTAEPPIRKWTPTVGWVDASAP